MKNKKYKIRYPELWLPIAEREGYVRLAYEKNELDHVSRMIRDMYYGRNRYEKKGRMTLRQIARHCRMEGFTTTAVTVSKFIPKRRTVGGHNSKYGQRNEKDIEHWKKIAKNLGYSSVQEAVQGLFREYYPLCGTCHSTDKKIAKVFPVASFDSSANIWNSGYMSTATVKRARGNKLKY